MTVVYLSGPMRGYPEHNYPMFYEVESEIRDELEVSTWVWLPEDDDPRVEIINPARNFNGDQDHQPVTDYLAIDIAAVCRADILVLLPGWERSEGADRETTVARWLDKRFVLAEFTDAYGWTFTPTAVPERDPSPRGALLAEASALVTGDRNNTYGPPTQDFTRSAQALNAYGYRGPDGRDLAGHDIAIMVMSVKLSRLMWTATKRDSWVDIAGYAACGYECAMNEATAAA
jgi:hypothetical protein